MMQRIMRIETLTSIIKLIGDKN